MVTMAYETTSIEEAAALQALGHDLLGGHLVDRAQAAELRAAGDLFARAGSVVFELATGPDEHAFANTVASVRNRDVDVPLAGYSMGRRACLRLLSQLTQKEERHGRRERA